MKQAISAKEMYDAVHKYIEDQDVFISVAAVADYKVKNSSPHKLKKENSKDTPTLELEANPDILASVAALPKPPFCIGFAAESEKVLEYARAKRLRKGIPMLIANDVSQAMGKSTNQITIITDDEELSFPEKEKLQVAEEIVQSLARHLDKLNL